MNFYNLDMILSVGYRVNSKRGTQFRIWATRILRDHILKGYSANERRLKELNQAIRLIADVAERGVLSAEEATALLRVVADYSFSLDLLDAYDRQTVAPAKGSRRRVEGITLEEARQTVSRLREQKRPSYMTRGVGARQERIRPEQFLEIESPMPEIKKQRKMDS